jgi:hypothetical protein
LFTLRDDLPRAALWGRDQRATGKREPIPHAGQAENGTVGAVLDHVIGHTQQDRIRCEPE